MIAGTEAEHQSDVPSTKDTACLALTSELWLSFFWENWLRYNDTTLYRVAVQNWQCVDTLHYSIDRTHSICMGIFMISTQIITQTHFTNDVFTTIQIRRKIQVSVIQLVVIILQQNCAYAMTTVEPRANVCSDHFIRLWIGLRMKSPLHMNCVGKIVSEMGPYNNVFLCTTIAGYSLSIG